MGKWLLGVLLGVALSAGTLSVWRAEAGDDVTYERARRGRLQRHVALQGAALPAQSAVVIPKLPSRVARLFVREGQHVARGDKLILLDASELSVEVERKRLALRRAKLRARERDLRKTLDAAAAAVEREADEVDVRLAELELERSQSMLSDSILTAPIDGVVVQVGAKVGEMLSPLRANGGEGILIAGTDQYIVRGELDEYEAVTIRAGAGASINFEAVAGATTMGSVMGPPLLRRYRADARQAAMFEVTVVLGGGLPPGVTAGQTATVRIPVSDDLVHVLVPVSAIVHVDGADYVISQDAAGRPVPVRVRLGADDARSIIVAEGLEDGRPVAVGDLMSLRRRLWPGRGAM